MVSVLPFASYSFLSYCFSLFFVGVYVCVGGMVFKISFVVDTKYVVLLNRMGMHLIEKRHGSIS